MAIERGWWDTGVPVTLHGASAVTRVTNTHQAADLLLNQWPVQPGPKHLAARKAVLKAMTRHRDAKALAAARKAFDEAAAEAGIRVD
jgi:hypothetical protein